MTRICISTPTKGYLRAETSDWRLRAFVQLAPEVEVHSIITPKPLEHARNEQALRFLASTCTHLFLLDADCVPQEGTIQKLVAYDLPIIAAPHPTLVRGEVGLMVLDRAEGRGYVQHRPFTGLQKVDAVGAAGLLIRRDVLESLVRPWFRCLYNEDGLLALSEDFYFCEQAIGAGFEIWAQCDLVQQHWVERVI